MHEVFTKKEKILLFFWITLFLISFNFIFESLWKINFIKNNQVISQVIMVATITTITYLVWTRKNKYSFLNKSFHFALYLLGSETSNGKLRFWMMENKVHTQWNFYKGIHNCHNDTDSLIEFIHDTYGIDTSDITKKNSNLNNKQVYIFLSAVVPLLIKNGSVFIQEVKQVNNEERKNKKTDFYKYVEEIDRRNKYDEIENKERRLIEKYEMDREKNKYEERARNLSNKLAGLRQLEYQHRDNSHELYRIKAEIGRVEGQLMSLK